MRTHFWTLFRRNSKIFRLMRIVSIWCFFFFYTWYLRWPLALVKILRETRFAKLNEWKRQSSLRKFQIISFEILIRFIDTKEDFMKSSGILNIELLLFWNRLAFCRQFVFYRFAAETSNLLMVILNAHAVTNFPTLKIIDSVNNPNSKLFPD